jgi:hypothetical protein
MKNIFILCFVALSLTMLPGCDEHGDPQGKIVLDEAQTASVSMRGRWGQASDESLPFGTTPGVLNNLILEFRIDDDYKPSDFSATGAPYFFSGTGGKWSWADAERTSINLQNILPVTSISVMEQGYAIRLTFTYEGPEAGKVGEYGVTLRKIAP